MASNIESPNLSRRGFVFAAGTAALAAAGAGLAGCAPAAIKEGEGNAPEKKAVPDVFTDGVPTSRTGTSMHGPIDVKTVIADGAIADVAVLNHNESRVIGEHADREAMPQRIVESQCVDADCHHRRHRHQHGHQERRASTPSSQRRRGPGRLQRLRGPRADAPDGGEERRRRHHGCRARRPHGRLGCRRKGEERRHLRAHGLHRRLHAHHRRRHLHAGNAAADVHGASTWCPRRTAPSSTAWRYTPGACRAEDNPYYNPDMPFITHDTGTRRSRAVDKMLGIGVAFCPIGRVGRAAARPRRLPDRRQVRHGDRHALRAPPSWASRSSPRLP